MKLVVSTMVQWSLYPIQTGGGGGEGAIVPGLSLDVYNFFISKLNQPNLVTFPNIYLGTIWNSKCLSIKSDVICHMKSSAYVVDLKRNVYGPIICPPSFVVIALIFSELRGEGRISPSPPPQSQKTQKNPV